MRKISMKLKIKSTKKTKPKKESLSSLGSLEELRDKKYLEKLRKKHHEGDALDNYCDMLETQINSLVDKLIPLSEENVELTKKLNADESHKHIRKLREHINAAEDQLLQAQTYARDKIDKS